MLVYYYVRRVYGGRKWRKINGLLQDLNDTAFTINIQL